MTHKEHGTPTKGTVGAVGDIYIDLSTGDKYRCTFAYKPPYGGKIECDWVLVSLGNRHKNHQKTT